MSYVIKISDPIFNRLNIDYDFYDNDMPVISNFHESHDFLSNFYIHSIYYNGFLFPTSEHAYQAHKCLEIGGKDFLAIQSASKPGIAKNLGQVVMLRDDWLEVKDSIMLDILRVKFSDIDLKRKLLETKGFYLVEGNTWHDNYWGICFNTKCHCSGKIGLNVLGRLLMQVRKEADND